VAGHNRLPGRFLNTGISICLSPLKRVAGHSETRARALHAQGVRLSSPNLPRQASGRELASEVCADSLLDQRLAATTTSCALTNSLRTCWHTCPGRAMLTDCVWRNSDSTQTDALVVTDQRPHGLAGTWLRRALSARPPTIRPQNRWREGLELPIPICAASAQAEVPLVQPNSEYDVVVVADERLVDFGRITSLTTPVTQRPVGRHSGTHTRAWHKVVGDLTALPNCRQRC